MVNKNKPPDEKKKEAHNRLETTIAEFRNFKIDKAAVAIKVYPTLTYTIIFEYIISFMEKVKILSNGFFICQALPFSISLVVKRPIFILVYL